MFKTFYEDIQVGDRFSLGDRLVEKEEIIAFAEQYDPQAFHINEEAARNSVFGALCASGWHTCAMVMRLHVDYMQKRGVASMGSPGVDKLRWHRPLFPGDRIFVDWCVTAMRESKSRPGLGLVEFQDEVKNQKGEMIMTMTATLMLLQRGAMA